MRVTKAMLEEELALERGFNDSLRSKLFAANEQIRIFEKFSTGSQAHYALETAANLAEAAAQLAKSSAYIVDRSRLHP